MPGLTWPDGEEPVLLHGYAGVASADAPEDLPRAAHQARLALKVTARPGGPGPCVVHYEDLGVLAQVIGRFTVAEAAAVDDVRRIDELSGPRPWIIDTLQAVVDSTSLRQAAVTLHLHHSTLQERLTWLGSELGYTPTHPGGRQRAAVAVLLWRVAHSAAGTGD